MRACHNFSPAAPAAFLTKHDLKGSLVVAPYLDDAGIS